MKKKNPIEVFLNQIYILMDRVKEHKEKALKRELPEDIEDQVQALESHVEEFLRMHQTMLRESGISEDEIQQSLKKTPVTATEQQKKLLDRAKKLRREVHSTERGYALQMEQIRLRKKTFGKKGRKSQSKKRKQKFRRLGGQEGWTPL